MSEETQLVLGAEVGDLKDSLNRLVEAIFEAAPKERKHYRTLVFLALIGGPFLFALTMGFAIKATVDTHKAEHLLRQGVNCLLADMDDHRHTNQFAHDQLAARHGFPPIVQPDVIPLSREQAEAFKANCEPYIKSTLGLHSAPTGTQAGGKDLPEPALGEEPHSHP